MCRYNGNGLTASQQVFCDEYLIDHNGTRAYLAAYPRVKSEDVAKVCASRLLTIANVSAYVTKREAVLQDARVASAREVREFLTGVLRGNISEYQLAYVGRGMQEIIDAPTAMSSRLKAAELLARMQGLFTDQVNVSVAQMPKITACGDGSVYLG